MASTDTPLKKNDLPQKRKGTVVWIPGQSADRLREVSSSLEVSDASFVCSSVAITLGERVNRIAVAFKLSPVAVVQEIVDMYSGLYEDYLHKETELRNHMTSVASGG